VWLALVFAVSGVGCAPQRQTRTDLEPLTRRLNLPGGISAVRWVSVPEHESGCDWVPEPDRAYRLYASVMLDPVAWATLGAAVAPGMPTTFTLPADIARAMLPATLLTPSLPSANTTISGIDIPNPRLSKSEQVHIARALRVGSALVLELRLARY
jgi:hypothetical protein